VLGPSFDVGTQFCCWDSVLVLGPSFGVGTQFCCWDSFSEIPPSMLDATCLPIYV